MAKKKQYTFADEANDIMKRFPRREFDPIEAKDYKEAMKLLMQEQESAREAMQLVDTRNNIYSKNQSFNGKGTTYFDEANRLDSQRDSLMNVPNPTLRDQHMIDQIPSMKEDLYKHQVGFARGGKMMRMDFGGYNPLVINSIQQQMKRDMNPTMVPQSFLDFQNSELSPTPKNIIGQSSEPVTSKPTLSNTTKQFLPTMIAGATNIGTNLLMERMAKNNLPKVNAAMVTPEKMNLTAQREQAIRDANVSKNVALRNARNLGSNKGSTLSNMGAIGAGVDRNLGNVLTQLNLGEQQFNVGAANQANLANQASQNRANQMNAQLKYQNLQDRMGYLGAAGDTLSQMPREYNLIRRDNEQMDWWNKYLDYLNSSYGNQPFTGVPKFGG